ncbi:RNA polymerase sigma factor [Spirosoma utsteinense]|uniref:RNA polymerase sigma-70 factor (ECF subfamily) n=1 Tax=Spirosoma utsteinense TaxID=2585773 RepID=A0ABR6W6S2_9BACT|nr:sigma-70 family RNA polymerase sigma factor [Spirosoma utsteinense]MBC3786101.1 RNA polymerase sigma-70 factor (ECF subfamily) [Spirosoma utsteinense]MBC3792290.1 RNA polymerase sigma-70 factor (ECF subfamily) [Spirosoma utsteinense]
MNHFTDEELVGYYLETGRNDYFEQLYERYCNKVHQTCLSFTKDTIQAEDLTQDIFIRLIGKLDGYKKQAKFSTWLYSITHNYCADQIKAPRRRHEVATDANWEGMQIPTDESAEQDEAEAQLISLAMSRLSEEERGILRHKYEEDLSIKDLAVYYSLTESAVKMRLKRSRDRLRDLYQEVVSH